MIDRESQDIKAMKISLDIQIENKLWNGLIDKVFLSEVVAESLMFVFKFDTQLDKVFKINILFGDDARIQLLNKNFLQKDKPTNVLSFPANEMHTDELKNYIITQRNKKFLLGDIIFSFETIQHESTTYNKTIHSRLTHLLVHSVLHLIGFDHIEDKERIIMESLEEKILNNLGITDPYFC